MMTVESLILGNIATVILFFIIVGYYKNKVDALTEDNKSIKQELATYSASINQKLDAYHRRLDTHGDDIVILNTKAELAITSKEVDEKYLSKEMFRQFEKHIDDKFDSVQAGLDKILSFIQKEK